MAMAMFIISVLIAGLSLTGAANIGVDYGRDANNLPSAGEVVALYKSQGITKMRIYEPFPDVLEALRGSGIELMVGVPNRDLQRLAEDNNAARSWVTNVLNYRPSVNIKYIAVGTEVTPVNRNSRYAQFIVRAMTNVFNAVKDAGLFNVVIVSTSIDTTVMDINWPPSAATFRADIKSSFMDPVLGFLSDTQGPLLVSIYPYFGRSDQPGVISSEYALFKKTTPEFTDPGNNLQYYNLFDAELDGVIAAIEKNLGPGPSSNSMLKDPYLSPQKAGRRRPRVIVTETGWPKAGNRPRRRLLADETVDNACTYYQNVIQHVKNGSPRTRGTPIETYLFAMFNENLKPSGIEQNFGLFYPNKAPACSINFRE